MQLDREKIIERMKSEMMPHMPLIQDAIRKIDPQTGAYIVENHIMTPFEVLEKFMPALAEAALKALAREMPNYERSGLSLEVEALAAAQFYCGAYHQLKEFGNEN